LVVFIERPGGRSQFGGALAVQQASRPALRDLRAWIAGHLGEDLSVAALADRAGLSERSSARAFRAEAGQTPAADVEALRVEPARDLVDDGAQSRELVARTAGLSSPEILRRAFHRRLGVSPAGYGERFRLAA
jgi:transcriptional regulator GlxA family with amidase domain